MTKNRKLCECARARMCVRGVCVRVYLYEQCVGTIKVNQSKRNSYPELVP